MFSKLTTKIALRKAGIPSNAFSLPDSKSGTRDPNQQNELLPFANPLANLSVPKSWQSWATPIPPPIEVAAPPAIGTRAPNSAKLRLPSGDGKPVVVVFLRNCGCAFAEKTFLEARRLANKYPRIQFIAVSHSSKPATDKWVSAIGGAWQVMVLIDEEREIYASWGLGVSTTWHLLNPWTQVAAQKLGKQQAIWGREVDPSGNRWQVGGGWAVDGMGTVRFGVASKTADDIPNLEAACQAVGAY
ncbi:hypothetical protein D0Z07_2951 [Hyphodiscus hymeniophilus]|uniref:Alkyl hydroperoxide reductase subunit C/ Thiol specific antioxidant domain-containing protein n=1 Tax=Hyphodiscus hymeniophilus TaxID=353542 RepID=A0A9P6VL87_9HELO|nr:hypothetical protein D0Z07_2951 [Hyphodiscus hymeniophilus]